MAIPTEICKTDEQETKQLEDKWNSWINWEPSFLSETKYFEFFAAKKELRNQVNESGVTKEAISRLADLILQYGGKPAEIV